MPPSVLPPLVALSCSIIIITRSSANALQLQIPSTLRHNLIAPVHPGRCRCAPPRCYNGVNNRRNGPITSLFSNRRDDGDSSGKKRKKSEDDGNDDEQDDDDAEGFVNANDFVDFEQLDKKFDDIPEYGVIRSLESPYENYNPVEPPSAEEIQLWMEKNDSRNKKQQKEKLWRRIFPWASPLASLLFPRRHAPSFDNRNSARERRIDNGSARIRRRSVNFDDVGLSTPRALRGFASTPDAARNGIVALNVAAFAYQIFTAVRYLPGFNRILAASVAGDAYSAAASLGGIPQWTRAEVVLRALGLAGSGAGVVIASGSSMRMGAMGRRVVGRGPIAAHSMGPFFLDYAHQPYPLSHFQKHRYLSSGFLHGSLLHLGMNLRALLSLPSWLENGIGKGVYLTAYLGAIVAGNIAHSLSNLSGRGASALCIGASGGVCGLYGLMMASLMKMGNADAAYYVLKQMVWLVAFGFLVPNVSNAGHVGGFVGGWLIGFLFGPGYERSYALNRADGASRDSADVEFRQMMGPGVYPSSGKAMFPVKYLWMGIGAAVLARPDLRLIPMGLVRGILEPGAVSGARALLQA